MAATGGQARAGYACAVGDETSRELSPLKGVRQPSRVDLQTAAKVRKRWKQWPEIIHRCFAWVAETRAAEGRKTINGMAGWPNHEAVRAPDDAKELAKPTGGDSEGGDVFRTTCGRDKL